MTVHRPLAILSKSTGYARYNLHGVYQTVYFSMPDTKTQDATGNIAHCKSGPLHTFQIFSIFEHRFVQYEERRNTATYFRTT